MGRLYVSFVMGLSCVFALGAPALSQETTLPTGNYEAALGIAGSDSIIWVFRHVTDDDGLSMIRFAYLPQGPAAKRRFWTGPTVTGRVLLAAVSGSDVHVFFADGTHRRFAPLQFGRIANTLPPATRELNLPSDALPLVLAADGQRGVLYAVVPSRIGGIIEVERTRRTEWERALDDEEEDAQPSIDGTNQTPPIPPAERQRDGADSVDLSAKDDAGQSEPTASNAESEWSVVRYENGQWWLDRSVAPGVTPNVRPEDMSAHDGRIDLAMIDRSGVTPVISILTSQDSSHAFSLTGTMRSNESLSYVSMGRCGDAPCVVVAAKAGADYDEVHFARCEHGSWSRLVPLLNIEGAAVRFSIPNAAVAIGDAIAAATVIGDGAPTVGLWAVDTGQPLSEPIPADVIADSSAPIVHSPVRQFVLYAIMVVVVVAVLVWRRERVVTYAPLLPGQKPARLERRMVAFVIDIAILSPVWIYAVFALWRSAAPNMTVAEQLAQPQQLQSTPSYWSGALVGTIFALYGGVFEWLIGQTPGKRIVRCGIAGEGGHRCRPRQIVVRNVLRILEFHFPPLVVLAALTPSRQRLGDMLARTVVIETDAESGSVPPDERNGSDKDWTA